MLWVKSIHHTVGYTLHFNPEINQSSYLLNPTHRWFYLHFSREINLVIYSIHYMAGYTLYFNPEINLVTYSNHH